MEKNQIRAFRTYQHITLGLLSVFNLWHYRTNFSTILCMLLFASSVILVYMFAYNVYWNRHSVPALLVHLGRLLTAVGTVFKLTFFTMNFKHILNLYTTLLDEFEENLARRMKSILHCSVYKFTVPAYIQMVSFFLACVLTASTTGVYILRHLIQFKIPDTNYTLIISNGHGYPWTVSKEYLYHVHFLFELGQLTIICITAISIDFIFSFCSYLLCSNLTAVSVTLNNLQSKKMFLDSIHTCLKKHVVLKECRECMERIFGPIALLHIVTNSVQLCAFMYLLMITEIPLNSKIYVFTYALGKVFQTFMYCWYGTCIRNSSEELHEAVYFSKWQNSAALDVHVKTSVTIALMQKPMTICAILTPLDLETFCSVLNTAMSYFCLLQSLEN